MLSRGDMEKRQRDRQGLDKDRIWTDVKTLSGQGKGYVWSMSGQR